MTKNNPENGFSLIDLLVGLAIMALLLSVTIPSVNNYQSNLKLKSAGKELITDLRYAQQLTITEQVPYSILINLANNKYELIKMTTPTTTIKSVTLPSNVSFSSIDPQLNSMVTFNSFGGVNVAGNIYLNNDNSTSTVEIKPSGYVQATE